MPKMIMYCDTTLPTTMEIWTKGEDSVYIQMIEKNTQCPDEFITMELTRKDIITLIEDLKGLIAE